MNININEIESDQQNRFDKRRINMYRVIKDKPTKRKIKYIGDKLKFMFKNDSYGQLNADIQVFHLVSHSPLTLDIINNQVLKHGQKAAQKGATIEQFLQIINDEYFNLKSKTQINQEEAMRKIIDMHNNLK